MVDFGISRVVKTGTASAKKNEPLVLYDADCGFCLGFVRRCGPLLVSHGFTLLPLQTPGLREQLGLSEAQLLAEMRLLQPDGGNFGGADALVEISRSYWWAWPLRLFAILPGGRPLLRAVYRRIAANRHCLGNACAIGCQSRHQAATTFFELP